MMAIMPRLMLLSVLSLLLLLPEALAIDPFMNFKQPCKPFTCSSSKVPVPKKDFVFTANGCGTADLPMVASSDVTECCNWHDACYSVCGMKKATCESRLEKCMKTKCAAMASASDREKCDSTVKLFQLGTQMMGCPAYQASQREACRCVSKGGVAKANRERLVHFLRANKAPATELEDTAVDALLAKYAGQEPKMFQRLLRKYPAALQMDASKKSFMDGLFGKGPSDLDTMQFPKDSNAGRMRDGRKPKQQPEEADAVDEHIEL